jgi:DNA polymerase I
MSKLLLIDGHAIIHRAYHSIPDLDFRGQPVNALYGFYSMLISALTQLEPKYLIVCLDSPGPTFRQSEFVGYRAKRKPADRSLVSQLPLLASSLADAGVATFSFGGYEADDLIATIAHRAENKPFIDQTIIITGDKDLMQLVSSKTSLLMPLRGLSETKLFQPQDVFDKLGVYPHQVVDLKALMGDMSDNYPGVADLLLTHHDLDSIYLHLDQIKPSLRQKLTQDKETAYLSQKLALLIDDIPLKFKFKDSLWNQNLFHQLKQMLKNYNFKSLISRLDQFYQPRQSSLF